PATDSPCMATTKNRVGIGSERRVPAPLAAPPLGGGGGPAPGPGGGGGGSAPGPGGGGGVPARDPGGGGGPAERRSSRASRIRSLTSVLAVRKAAPAVRRPTTRDRCPGRQTKGVQNSA